MTVYPNTVTPTPDDWLSVVVAGRRALTEYIDEFTLVPARTDTLPSWEPGAHIDVATPAGEVRQYSLCSDPKDPGHYRIAVERREDGRGGSVSLHRHLFPGMPTRIGHPRNHFALTRALAYVFVAGGVGITPLISLIGKADAAGRPWRLIYTGRRRSTMAYADDLVARYGERVQIHCSQSAGRLDLRRELAGLDRGTAVYTCGPESMHADVVDACADQPAVDAFSERFTAPGRSAAADEPFEVSLAYSARTLTIPSDRSILDTLEEHGVLVGSSCRQGICGTCEIGVVSGEVEHRDSVLTPEERAENESMMICVSRCTSGRLVLEA
ncbi:MAG: PDR/VanB family oxidoreductase [Gordonia sp. (in: high G+C Gram-positive bacteria)]